MTSTRRLQHNFITSQRQFFSITMCIFATPITSFMYNDMTSSITTQFHHIKTFPSQQMLLICITIFITIVLVFVHYNYALCTLVTIMLCVPRCSSGISYRSARHGSGSPMCDSLIRNISLCRRRQTRHGRRDPAGPEPDR
jgi:hypothetical protein